MRPGTTRISSRWFPAGNNFCPEIRHEAHGTRVRAGCRKGTHRIMTFHWRSQVFSRSPVKDINTIFYLIYMAIK